MHGTCNTSSQIKFKTSTLGLILCDYSDIFILIKGAISDANTVAADAAANNNNKKVMFKIFKSLYLLIVKNQIETIDK